MKSFVQYSPDTDFPIENLPYGVFSTENDVSLVFWWVYIFYVVPSIYPVVSHHILLEDNLYLASEYHGDSDGLYKIWHTIDFFVFLKSKAYIYFIHQAV